MHDAHGSPFQCAGRRCGSGALLVGLTGSGNGAVEIPTPDLPGTTTAFTSAPLERDLDVAGVPKLRVRFDAPAHAAFQDVDPTTKLVVFARLLDVAPDGTATLPRNLLSAARVGDVTKPVEIELPGIVHRFAKGHRLRLQLSSSDTLSRGNTVPGVVTVRFDGSDALTVPVLGAPGPTGSGPDGTTPYGPPATPGTPSGGPPPGTAPNGGTATTPGRPGAAASRCTPRSRITVRFPRARRGDRVRSVDVRIDGRRVKVLRATKRARRVTATRVTLRRLPATTFRVTVAVRTAKGRTLRSARTYRGCPRG